MIKKLLLFFAAAALSWGAAVYAQDDGLSITRPSSSSEAITIKNPSLGTVTGEGILSGTGTKTVTLWDRSLYINQPKSVVLPNAKEYYQNGIEVPKPLLDRPITDPWDDLKEGYACEAILNRPYYFQQMKFGEEFDLDITFRNVGTATWDFNVDVMKYTGDPLEKNPDQVAIDLWKTVDPDSEAKNSHIVKPGESIRVKIPMRAPTEKYHDDNKYYGAYTLVRNWDDFASAGKSSWDNLHDGHWDRMDGNALFCPAYFYIYVPE